MRRLAPVLALVALVGAPTPSLAQGLIGRQRRAGEIGVSAVGIWRQNGSRNRTLDQTFRQWLKLPLRGAVFHPRIFSYTLTLRPTLGQNLSPGIPSALVSREFGFDFGAQVLSAKPVSLVLSAGRVNGSTSGGFGSDGDFVTANMGGVMNLRFPALPARLTYFSRSSENMWLTDPDATPVVWSNNTRTVSFVAQNSKLRLGAERLLFDDRILQNDFAVWNLSGSHRFRWGKGSHIQSAFDRTSRTGTNPYTRQTWRELLHIQHTRVTNTQFGFQRHSSRTPAGVGSTTSFNLAFSSRVSRWLTTGITGATRSSRFRASQEGIYSAGPTLGLRLNLPLGLRFNGAGMFGYERRTREYDNIVSLEVIDDRHVVDATRSFLLEQTGIDTTSIEIRSDDLTLSYIKNFDYMVVTLPDIVEIVFPPGSRVQPGDVVLVNYRFTPSEELTGTLLIGRFNAALSKSGFTLRYSRTLRDSDNTSAAAVIGLGTLDETRISLGGQARLPIGRWDIDLTRIGRTSSALNFTTYEGNTSLGFAMARSLNLSVGANARRSRQESRTLQSRTAFVSWNWVVGRPARVIGRIQAWDLLLDGRPADRSIGGNVDLNLRIAAVDVWIQFMYNVRTIPDPVTRNRLSGRLVRRF